MAAAVFAMGMGSLSALKKEANPCMRAPRGFLAFWGDLRRFNPAADILWFRALKRVRTGF